VPKPAEARIGDRGENSEGAIKAHRKAYFDGWYDCPIYDRERLLPVTGSAGRRSSSRWIRPPSSIGQAAHIDRFGNIIIRNQRGETMAQS
jgi:hypothetical protein